MEVQAKTTVDDYVLVHSPAYRRWMIKNHNYKIYSHSMKIANFIYSYSFICYYRSHILIFAVEPLLIMVEILLIEHHYIAKQAQYRSPLPNACSSYGQKETNPEMLLNRPKCLQVNNTINLLSIHDCYSLLIRLYCCDATVLAYITRRCSGALE